MPSLAFLFVIAFCVASTAIGSEPAQKSVREWIALSANENEDTRRLIGSGCVAEKLRFGEHGDKLIDYSTLQDIAGFAVVLCDEAGKQKEFLEMFIGTASAEGVGCVAKNLAEIEPSAAILEGVEAAGSDVDCKNLLPEAFLRTFVERRAGELRTFCTPADALAFKKLFYSCGLVKLKAADEDVSSSQMEKLRADFTRSLQTSLDCMLSQI